MRIQKPAFILISAGILLELFFLLLLRLYHWDRAIPQFLALFFLSFTVYLITAALAYRNYFESIQRASLWIFGLAAIFRLTLLACPPSLSEDFYRYVWDGRIQAAGFGPYDYPPKAPELESLRNKDYELIGHKQFYTPYPPAAQNIFHLLARITSNNFVFRFGFVLFDLLLIEVLRRLLREASLSPALLLIYAWHPLVVIEFTGSSHMDIIAISMMFVSILLLQYKHAASAGAIMAAAILTKYLPVFSIPWLIRKGGWKFATLFLIAAALLLWQYYTPDQRVFRGIAYFYRKWWFNDSVFGLLYVLLGGAEPARITGGIATILTLGFCYWKKFPIYRALLWVFGTVLIFSPVVHPWYALWILPLLVFHRNRAWLFFTGWIAMSYLIRHVYPIGVWKQEPWLKILVYFPFLALLLIDTVKEWIPRLKAIPSQKTG